MENTKLKRPKKHDDTKCSCDIVSYSHYSAKDVDSFLSQIADKLEEARKLREKILKSDFCICKCQNCEDDFHWRCRHDCQIHKADAIEEEVIRTLKGEAKEK